MHEFTRRAALFAAAGVPTTASTAKGRFPKGFLWGAATAAHQVEGNNTNSDFWLLEHIPQSPFAEPSGDALDHYHRFRDDIRLLAALGLNTYRFSVEWARIEPEPGRFSRAAVDHYVRVALACREFGVRPMATFHHFTSPRWLAFEGGWDTVRTADRFARYCEFAGKHLGPHIDYACTLNEPNLSRMLAMVWPEYMKVVATGLAAVERHLRRGDFRAYMYGDPDRIHETMLAAHPKAVVALKSSPGSFAVGIALAMQDEQAAPGGDSTRAGVRAKLYDDFLDLTSKDDFVGVQTYTKNLWGASGLLPWPQGTEMTQMDYAYAPEALESTLRYAWKRSGGRPLIVTENGIGTADDHRRIEFTNTAVRGVRSCLKDGVDVRGYVHWSLLDNFEWESGYKITFGLVQVDRKTFRRIPKRSARHFGALARSNGARLG